MLARLGSQKVDTFSVIDLTAGYHQAPLTLSTRVYMGNGYHRLW